MKKWPLFGLLFLLLEYPIATKAQRIENLRASFESGKVMVKYDITGGNARQTYSIQLYGSHNNYSQALRQVTGDVGEGISGGKDKTITWNAEAELVTHSGNITFRVSGSLIPLKLTVLTPTTGAKVKKGKSTVITWEGGKPDVPIRMELYRGTTRIIGVGESKNTGLFNWDVPKKLDKGKYNLHVTAGQEKAVGEEFTVKPPISKGLLIGAGVVVVGGILYLVIPPPPPPDDKLPEAPDPRTN